MSNGAADANKSANTQYTADQTDALNKYQSAATGYMSNVNAAVAAGNPYTSKAYLTNQNLATSAAANAANTKAAQQTRDTALRTGTNSAAVGAQIAENARAGQRQTTAYTADRDTANEDKWLTQSNALRGQQLAGANSELNAYGDSITGRSDSLNNLTTLQGQDDALWQAGIGAVGAAGAGAATKV